MQKKPIRAYLLTCLLLVTLLMLVASCGPSGALNEAEAQFKKQITALLKQFSTLFGPALKAQSKPMANHALLEFFKKAHQNNQELWYGIWLLDAEGKLVAGRYPEEGHPDGKPDNEMRQDYSKYKSFQEVMQRKVIKQDAVYVQGNERMYYVAGPAQDSDGRLLGMVCLGFDETMLKEGFKLSPEEFLKINMNR